MALVALKERAATLPADWRMAACESAFQELGAALTEGRLQPFYQPIIGIGAEAGIRGAEALLRWDHPCNGLLSAAQFLSVVEEAEMLVDVDLATARRVSAQLVSLDKAGWHLPLAWLNTSVAEVFSDRFIDLMGEVVGASGLAGRIGVEVPQILLCIDEVAVRHRLGALRNAGVLVGIDRFGANMSLTAYRTAIDSVALDPVVVQRVDRDPAARRRLSAVIEFAHSEGLRVVAKGIEELGHFDVLQDLGCDAVQGYLFGEPMPAGGLFWSADVPETGVPACTWLG